MTHAEIQRIWNSHAKQTNVEARVFSCAVSAIENNGEIDRGRAVAVLRFIWPEKIDIGAVPSEIRGRSSKPNNNRNRQGDFARLTQLIRGALDVANREADPQTSTALDGSSKPQPAASGQPAQTGAGFGSPVENKLVEAAAVQAVVNHYQTGGWWVRSVERDKCGFDLECTKGAVVEQVEVKGVSGTELCFVITAGEVRQARENPKFVLVVVTSALSPSPTLTKVSGEEFGERFELATIQHRASLKR